MATVPSATTVVQQNAAASISGQDTICVVAPVPSNADTTPRLFGSAAAIAEFHGYSEGVEYAAFHAAETRKPILFVGLPVDVEGTVGRVNASGNSGSSAVSVAAGSGGCRTSHSGVVRCVTGGTVGTNQIVVEYSLDGGLLFRRYRLGTDTSITLADANVTISFTVGTLVAGDTLITWEGTSPRASVADMVAVRTALAAQMKFFRSLMWIGDVQDGTEASAIMDQMDAYETENERFAYARVSTPDRLPLAEMSHTVAKMVAGTSLTFAEVGATGDTITRATGSWLADGFAAGDTIVVTGTAGNNVTGVIASLTATVITLGTEDLAAETTALATVVGYPTLTFAEVGATGDTITRNRGSWLADGFRVGDIVTIDGSASNDITTDAITGVTALVLTLNTSDLAAEVVSTNGVSVSAGQTKAVWMAALDAEFEDVTGSFRLDVAAGRARKASPYSGFNYWRPVSWAASLREYQHDLQIPTWQKKLGPTGWSLEDADGNLVAWDDRVDGGAGSAARFTTMRTWSNGPNGAFITLSLTRDDEANLTSRTHNAAVVNLACSVVQLNTENIVGEVLVLNDDGTATSDALATIEMRVNSALALELLVDKFKEGPRASKAVWTASKTDVLNVPEALLTGVLDLNLNGTVHSVFTAVRVRSGGQ